MEEYQNSLDEYGKAFSKVFDAAANADVPFEKFKNDLVKKREDVMVADIVEGAAFILSKVLKNKYNKGEEE